MTITITAFERSPDGGKGLRLRSTGLLDEFPRLAAYVARGEARPAYRRAFAAQLAVNGRAPAAR